MLNQHNNQQSSGFWNVQSVSSSSTLHLRQMPQTWYTNQQNQVLQGSSACMGAPLANVQSTPLQTAQHGTGTQTVNSGRQNTNSVPQQNVTIPPSQSGSRTLSWIPSVYMHASNGTEQQSYQLMAHQPVLLQYQSFNGHHNRSQIAHQPAAQSQQTYLPVQNLSNQSLQTIQNNQCQMNGQMGNGPLYNNSANQFPGTAQRPIASAQPSNQPSPSYSCYNRNQVQHPSQIQHIYRNNSASYSHLNHNGNKHQSLPSNQLPQPQFTNLNFVIQNQQSSALSLPQDNVQPQNSLQQCNNIPVFDKHVNTCYPTLPAINGNKQPQAFQLNNGVTGSPRSYQSSNIPASETSPTTSRKSIPSYFQRTQTPAQRDGTTCQTPGDFNTTASYSQASETTQSKNLHRLSEYQRTVQKPAIVKENEQTLDDQWKSQVAQHFIRMHDRRTQNTESKDGHKSKTGRGKVQYVDDLAETRELVMALQKALRQVHKAVAVVPPISQPVPSPEKSDDVDRSCDDSLPFKIDAVWTLVKDSMSKEQESNAPCLPKEVTEKLLHLFSVPQATQEHKLEDGATLDGSVPDAQTTDIPENKTASDTSQGPECSSTNTECNNDNLSKIKECYFTPKEYIERVKLLERQEVEMVKELVTDNRTNVLDLYWDGNEQNALKHAITLNAELSDLFNQLNTKDILTAKFQFIQPQDLQMIADRYYILNSDTDLPTEEEFKSSWLNVDGQPADIDKVLAEQILEMDYTDFDSTIKETCTTTDSQDDKTISKDLADQLVCESKSTDKVSDMQEASKMPNDENLERQQQESVETMEISNTPMESKSKAECERVCSDAREDISCSSKDPVETMEMADTPMESESKAECERVCSDTREEISSFSEITEQRDLSNDSDSSDDSQLLELSLLSSEDAKKIFKEYTGCALKIEPSQLCKDGPKISETQDIKFNDFSNSRNQTKFRCPHVTDADWAGEHFCPKCWEDAPLLDLDLEEALFSPKDDSPTTSTPPIQEHRKDSCSPQFGKAYINCTGLSVSSSLLGSPTPLVEVSKSEPAPKPSEEIESCSSLSVSSPVKEPHQVVPKKTKTPREEVSPPKGPQCKKLKLTQSSVITTLDGLFIADIVTNKAISTNPHPSDLSVSPADYGHNGRDERKEIREFQSPINMNIQINAQPNVNTCESSNSSTDQANTTVTEKKSKLGESIGCSPSGKPLDKDANGRVSSVSVRVSKPIEEQVNKSNMLGRAELTKSLSLTQDPVREGQPQTKASRGKGSPPIYPLFKKLTVPKTVQTPAKDDLFTPDIVVKKVSTPKPHPCDLSVVSAKNGQNCKDERKEKLNVENRKPVVQSRTKTLSDKGSSPKYPLLKKPLKHPKIMSAPDEDDLFTPDIVVRKASTPKPYSSATPTEHGKHRRDQQKQRKGRYSSVITKIQHQDSVQTKTQAHGKWVKSSLKSRVSNAKPPATNMDKAGQNKEVKKILFAPYGFNTSQTRAKPVYITVSDRPKTDHRYTDAVSAKQKIYSQWSSTFVEPKTRKKKHHKYVH